MAGRSDTLEKGKVDESDSVLIEDGGGTDEEWKSTFREKLHSHSPLPASCCIFRVPEVLRIQKKEAYEPVMVSIGPFHRGREQFQLMENVKGWYLECLLSRLNISLDSLIDRTKVLEEDARACYSSDPFIHFDQNKFVEMLILDGCFLIELFRKAFMNAQHDADDPIFNRSCVLEYIYHDLVLLENQLPWSVLEFFYDLIESSNPIGASKPSLGVLVIHFFKQSAVDAGIFNYPEPNYLSRTTLHILDLIRTALVLKRQDSLTNRNERSSILWRWRRIASASTLSDKVGVKFKKVQASCILDIEFSDGIFRIPKLAINSSLGPLFRNMIAYEQLYHGCSHEITSYAVLMDSLLGSIKDVDLLCKEGILDNMLSAEDASQFFKQLLYNYDPRLVNFHHAELCSDVSTYRFLEKLTFIPKAKRNKWKKQLKEEYFGTPWKILSWIVAGMILVLTLLQTIFTIKSC